LRRCCRGGAAAVEGRRAGQPPGGQGPMEPPRRTIRRRHTLGDRPKSQPSLSKRDQRNLAPAAKDWREAAYSLGILKTGYLETASEQWDRSAAATSSVKKTRFVVLTHAQLSWFKRNPGDTEYGDERGAIPLDQVTSVKLDGEKIEVFDQGGLRRWFLCRDGKAKAWRDAIDVARQARCRSPAASSPREAPSALIIRTRQYAKSIVETRAAYGAATLVEPAAPGEGFEVLRKNGDVKIDASSLAKAAAVGRCVLKADDGARVVLRAVAAEAPTRVKRSFFSSLVLLASVLYTIYALGLKAIFAIPLYAAALQKAYELLPEKVDDDRVAFSLTLEPPPKEKSSESDHSRSPERVPIAPETIPNKVDPSDTAAVRAAEAATGVGRKFIVGSNGDMREARKKWRASQRWRAHYGTDKILEEPHPKFKAIKKAYPHFWIGHGRDGQLVYLERIGHVDMNMLARENVSLQDMVRHYVAVHEFTWAYLAPERDGPRSYQCVLFDVDGLQLAQCRGVRYQFVKACAKIAREHYPERVSRVVICNAPQWFQVVWKVVKPWVDPKTVAKVSIVRAGVETLSALREICDDSQIPESFGGSNKDPERSEPERRLAAAMAA